MFNAVYGKLKKATIFEKLLLFAGISIGIFGFWIINITFFNNPAITWSFITAVFMWVLLIFIIILTDSNESIKDELSTIIREHIEETKLLKKEVIYLKDAMKNEK